VTGTAISRRASWRDRLLTEPRFQHWIARIPLLRAFARPHARALFALCSGFIHSQVLYASVKLGLLEALNDGPLSIAELQRRCALNEAAMRLLLSATDSLGLTELRRQQMRGLGLLGAALLGNPAVLQMIRHQPLFYADMADPIALLRGTAAPGELSAYWGYANHQAPEALDENAVGEYTRLMAATQSLVAEDVIRAYDFGRHRCLLDVGGGDGSFLRALAPRVPRLALMLFDLPAVTACAQTSLAAAGLSARVEIRSGDFHTDALPAGADVITLVRIVHDHDDRAAELLLRGVRRALPPGGRVVIAEPMRAVPGSLPAAENYLGFYLLAMRQGRVRSRAELQSLLLRAGFSSVRAHHTARPWQCALLSAGRA
jgi:demethylspheroidene O-methyltransferase